MICSNCGKETEEIVCRHCFIEKDQTISRLEMEIERLTQSNKHLQEEADRHEVEKGETL